MLRTSSSTSAAQGEVNHDESGAGVVASRSKNRQKVEESSKSPKSLKGLKNLQRASVRRNVYRSTDPPSIRYEELELPSDNRLRSLIKSINQSIAGLRSSFDTIFESIIDKAKLVELLMLCHVFSLEEPGQGGRSSS